MKGSAGGTQTFAESLVPSAGATGALIGRLTGKFRAADRN
jgi:hypothetical protein